MAREPLGVVDAEDDEVAVDEAVGVAADGGRIAVVGAEAPVDIDGPWPRPPYMWAGRRFWLAATRTPTIWSTVAAR
ncbi:MAG: hypothetical protein R2748_21105 [Bryobacterales bacterium]